MRNALGAGRFPFPSFYIFLHKFWQEYISRGGADACFGMMQANKNDPATTGGVRRLRIAVDFDGVLFDHVPYLLRGFRDAHDIDLEAEGFRFWDFFQYRSVRERNLTWNCVHAILSRIEADTTLHRMPPRDPLAAHVIREWRRQGHEVHVVTARASTSREVTELFLQTHAIEHDGLRMGVALKTGYDVLIDDAPHNVLMAAAAGGVALLMDHPYNRDVPDQHNPLRVRDWAQVREQVDRLVSRTGSVDRLAVPA